MSEANYPTFKRKQSIFWWTKNRRYIAYFFRELTGLFIFTYALFFVYQLYQLHFNEVIYSTYISKMTTPTFVILNVVFLLFSVYHSLTWFQLTAKVLPLKIQNKPIDTKIIGLASLALWGIFSYIVFIIMAGDISWLMKLI